MVPVWPNLTAQPAILGAQVKRVPLAPRDDGAWALDLQALIDAVTPATRVLLVNAPNNPTGWTLSRAEQVSILDHCRKTGTWIVADEVYERVWFEHGRAAPSFLDIAEPDDRLVIAQSFSKTFLMTGWRLGWLVLPPGHLDAIGKLIEFNSSCAPVFVQRGAMAALAIADDFVPGLVERLRAGRDLLVGGLQAMPDVRVALPRGGMYAFFRVEGQSDSLAYAKQLGHRPRTRLGARRGLRRRGRGLAALVLRDPGSWRGCATGWPGCPRRLTYNPRLRARRMVRRQARHGSVSPVTASGTGNRLGQCRGQAARPASGFPV